MAYSDIQAKVKLGLSKAAAALGGDGDEDVYLIQRTQTGGGNTPSDPPTYSDEDVLLENALFTNVSTEDVGRGDILSTDAMLVSNSDVEIVIGATIKRSGVLYKVVSQIPTTPRGPALVYKSVIRRLKNAS